MKNYEKPVEVGLKLIYEGHPINFCNRKGKIVQTLNPGKYIVTRVTNDYIYLMCDRKNATTSYVLYKDDVEGRINELEFADLTTTIGFIMRNLKGGYGWCVNNEELIKSAKKYNKGY